MTLCFWYDEYLATVYPACLHDKDWWLISFLHPFHIFLLFLQLTSQIPMTYHTEVSVVQPQCSVKHRHLVISDCERATFPTMNGMNNNAVCVSFRHLMAAAPETTCPSSSSEGMIRSGSWRPSYQVGHIRLRLSSWSDFACSSQER